MTGARSDRAARRMAHAVLMPGFTGTHVPPWLARAIEGGLGAVLYFAPNLADDPAVLSARLHELRADLLVASDEEGGAVTRLHAGAAGGSPHPTHARLGAGDPARTHRAAKALGGDLRAVGIDVALAPVVDVNSDPRNPVIGERAFGADPGAVARHGAAFTAGLHAVSVSAAAKHFPGHGDTRTDSHDALPVIGASMRTLRERELVPFAAAVDAGVDMVMVGHLGVTALGGARTPASVSPRAYRLLREELGFGGVAVTDALDMRAVSAGASTNRERVAHGAVTALAAGADLLCLGNPATSGEPDGTVFHAARRAVLDAVDRGEVPRARLADAAARVAGLRRREGRA